MCWSDRPNGSSKALLLGTYLGQLSCEKFCKLMQPTHGLSLSRASKASESLANPASSRACGELGSSQSHVGGVGVWVNQPEAVSTCICF